MSLESFALKHWLAAKHCLTGTERMLGYDWIIFPKGAQLLVCETGALLVEGEGRFTASLGLTATFSSALPTRVYLPALRRPVGKVAVLTI